MSDPVGVDVVGARQLRRALKDAGDDLQNMKTVHGDVSDVVTNRARLYAPTRSGKLARSIRSAPTKTRAAVRVGKKLVPYAMPIHWGWAARNIAPNPFLTDAADDTQKTWLPMYQNAIDDIAKEIETNT